MKNFIEVTSDKKKILLNVNQIAIVQDYSSGSAYDNDETNKTSYIGISVLHNGNSSHYHVDESYEEVKRLIEAAI